jgi:DNA-binding NtrC family response regulator
VLESTTMTGSVPQPARDYARLFQAMNEVLRAFSTDADGEDALRRSFSEVAQGFGAEKALLLLVEREEPLCLRHLCMRGLSSAQVQACERGESFKGVSSSIIRAAVDSRRVKIIEHPLFQTDPDLSPCLVGQQYSVLCTPILDPIREVVLAVLYFQNNTADAQVAYRASDAVWLEGYASAVGQAFAFCFQRQRRERELRELLQGRRRPEAGPDLIGESAHCQSLRRVLHEAYIPAAEAPEPDPVLILGERGTGKDLVARYIHAHSARRDEPFVAVNCAEVSDELASARFFGHKKGAFTGAVADELGFFRAAQRGVLFLDEIAELSPRAQGALLRVLENRTLVPVGETREMRVDVQVILATNRDPERALADGLLKADLFDRFRTQSITVQPLRDRPCDIPPLVQHFLGRHERRTRKKTLGLTQEALRAMVSYSWPGNVREVDRVCSLLITHARAGTRIDVALLEAWYPDVLRMERNPKAGALLADGVPMRDALRTFQRELILSRLEHHHWNVRAARESLGLPKTTFQRCAAALGIAHCGPNASRALEAEDQGDVRETGIGTPPATGGTGSGPSARAARPGAGPVPIVPST